MTKLRALMTPQERERVCAQRRASYQRNREKELAYAKAYREENKETLLEYWRNNNKKRSGYFKKWYEDNADKRKDHRARWKANNKERISIVQAEYLQKNLDRHRANQQNRRARKKNNGGKLSSDIVNRLLSLQKGKCACCGKPLGESFDLDHIVPLARGGGNSDDNVQLLTAKCNRQKGSSDPIAFMQRRGRLL